MKHVLIDHLKEKQQSGICISFLFIFNTIIYIPSFLYLMSKASAMFEREANSSEVNPQFIINL